MAFEHHMARKFTPRPSWGKRATVQIDGKQIPAWMAAEARKKEQSK